MSAPFLLLATSSYEYLARELMARYSARAATTGGSLERGAIERRRFPDGERYLRLGCQCIDRDVVLLGGTISDDDTLEVYDLACAAVEQGARRLTMVLPFFGYSTMERAVLPGEVVTAKNRARLLSSVPPAAMGNRVLMVDLHVSAIAHYFEGPVSTVHIYAKPVIMAAAEALAKTCQDGTTAGESGAFVLACTDAGRAKWVQSLADDMGVEAAFVYKRRLDGEHTEVTGVSAHVRDKVVIIYDDMIRTGGSLLGAARAYHDAGAAAVAAVTTHGLFPGDALSRLQSSGLLQHIACTDTHPRAHAATSDFVTVYSVAGLLLDNLRQTV